MGLWPGLESSFSRIPPGGRGGLIHLLVGPLGQQPGFWYPCQSVTGSS